MTKLNAWKMAGVVLLLCAVTAIVVQAQTFDTLLSFHGRDGAYPDYGSLVQGPDGNFYGTTSAGGANLRQPNGTIFKITPMGRLTTIYSFCAKAPDCADGASPQGGLVLAPDGSFYGTTAAGGTHSYQGGTVFRITPAGQLTTLYSFCAEANCLDGAAPFSTLVQASDGNFYGTTTAGGAGTGFSQGNGTVFKITSSGTLTTLHSFCTAFGCPDGSTPIAGLAQGSDGYLYGAASSGGDAGCDGGCGTAFRITLRGKFTRLYAFSVSQGGTPMARLTEGTNGVLYGAAAFGGANGGGTVYEIAPGDEVITLNSFSEYADGADPNGALIEATDQNFYGTTYGGGSQNGSGTAFAITPEGALTTLHTFCVQQGCPDGTDLYGGLLQSTNGTFYGATAAGGGSPNCEYGCGTVFSLDMGLAPFVTFVRSFGKVGQTGGILGQGFTGTTSVSLNGIAASFTVVSDTFIEATVPAGATTGYVSVATPSGTLTSNVKFRVIR
jgi:uncharacterized repeat protein (TIGR03803 family)